MQKDFKDYLENGFTYIQYNKFESDLYWGIPYNRLPKLNSLDILNSQFKVNRFNIVKNLTHNTILEVGWTILPIIVLLFVAIPSMKLLYYLENPLRQSFFAYDCAVTVIAHQWFWTYEFLEDNTHTFFTDYLLSDLLYQVSEKHINSGFFTVPMIDPFADDDYEDTRTYINSELRAYYDHVIANRENVETNYVKYDSYIMSMVDVLDTVGLRLLDTDYALVVPVGTRMRFLITSDDVIHSWAIPSLGIKTDAIPGRISLASTIVLEMGVYYGQCSEICGVGHGFMPIKVIAI
jgi:cytochrome c oxidase subunit 2